MRQINKNLIYSDYPLQLHVNCDGSIEYSVNDGQLSTLDIEISESVHNYFVNLNGRYDMKLFQGTKAQCVCYVIEYIKSIIK